MNTVNPEVFRKLAEPLPKEAISWRIDSKPSQRDGRYSARFVSYVDAQTVRERLDSIVCGNWDLTLDLLPPTDIVGNGGEVTGRQVSFKARLQIHGVIREDVGIGDDYKAASTDAFKRAAVRFGIASELYSREVLYVDTDSNGKPLEDPETVYQRKFGSGAETGSVASRASSNAGSGGNSQANGATNSASKSSKLPVDRTMPFGKTKGKRLGSLPDTELESALAWCKAKGKFSDLVEDIEAVLKERAKPLVDDDDVRGSLTAIETAYADEDAVPF